MLLFGIVFSLIARTGFIFLGAALINSFAWVFYLFGLILLLTAGNMVKAEGEDSHTADNMIIRLARKVFHTSDHYDGDKLFTIHDGKRAMTPMLLVMVAIGGTDASRAFSRTLTTRLTRSGVAEDRTPRRATHRSPADKSDIAAHVIPTNEDLEVDRATVWRSGDALGTAQWPRMVEPTILATRAVSGDNCRTRVGRHVREEMEVPGWTGRVDTGSWLVTTDRLVRRWHWNGRSTLPDARANLCACCTPSSPYLRHQHQQSARCQPRHSSRSRLRSS